MSENILYYLDQNKVPKKEWNKVANAVDQWLSSYKKLQLKSVNTIIEFILTETPFEKSSVHKEQKKEERK